MELKLKKKMSQTVRAERKQRLALIEDVNTTFIRFTDAHKAYNTDSLTE